MIRNIKIQTIKKSALPIYSFYFLKVLYMLNYKAYLRPFPQHQLPKVHPSIPEVHVSQHVPIFFCCERLGSGHGKVLIIRLDPQFLDCIKGISGFNIIQNFLNLIIHCTTTPNVAIQPCCFLHRLH